MRYAYIRDLELRRALIKRDWALDVAEVAEKKGEALGETLGVLVLAEQALTDVMNAQGVTAVMCNECEQMHPQIKKNQVTCPRCLSVYGQEERVNRYESQFNQAGETRQWIGNDNWKNAACEFCGGGFVRKRKSHKYCSNQCSMSGYSKRNSAHKNCEVCNEPIPFGTYRSKYCCDVCKQKAKRKRSNTYIINWREKNKPLRKCAECGGQDKNKKKGSRGFWTNDCRGKAMNRRRQEQRRNRKESKPV